MAFFVKKTLTARTHRRLMSSLPTAPLLLSANQVYDLSKANQSIRLIDASWFMPNSSRDPHKEFMTKRIPTAQFLDIDKVASTHKLGLKHMMPSEQLFASTCENFGIEPSSHVVIYDTSGVFSSPRALFMFRSFGHERSSIINGGLPAWIENGLPVDSGPSNKIRKTEYQIPKLENKFIRSYEQIVANAVLRPDTNPHAELVLDARARGRYLGSDPEPRPGLSSGHIPHSFSLPFNLFLQKNSTQSGTEYTTFLSEAELQQTLVQAVGPERADSIIRGQISVITSCGSGMTAAVLWLGLKLLGVHKTSLYDESWTGYAMRPGSKIEKSASRIA